MLYSRPLIFIAFLLTYAGASDQILTLSNTATPTNFIAGTTKTLEIKCSIPMSSIDQKGIFSVFIINHSVDNGTYKSIASYSASETRNEIGDHMTVSGNIEVKTESFIKLILKDPLSTDAGSYQCVVNGVTPGGLHATMIRDITMTLDNLPKECSPRIKDLEETIARLKNSCSPVNFVKKGRSENSFYYLSFPASFISDEDARKQCQLKGGYLVEVDSSGEYTFLVKFLKVAILEEEISYYSVLTGGSDESKEGDWIYPRSGKKVNFIQWGLSQPDGGRKANCLHFWGKEDWKMSDERCTITTGNNLYGYICEVSV